MAQSAELAAIFRLKNESKPAFEEIDRSVGSLESHLEGINRAGALAAAGLATAATAITAVTVAVGGLAVLVGGVGGKFDALKQNAGLAFETMLGSADAARDHLEALTKFAQETPFELPGLIQASQRLHAFQFDTAAVIPILTTVGDAMAGLGRGQEGIDRATLALGQMQAKGKATAEDLNQLTELGIPAFQALAEKIGVSVPEAMEMVTKGSVDSSTAINAVLTFMDSRFSGLMEKQAQTVTGMLSNVQDAFQQFAGQLAAPAFERASGLLSRIVDATSSAEFQQRINEAAQAFDDLLNAAGPAVDWLTTNVPRALQQIADVAQRVFSGDLKGAGGALENTLGEWGAAFANWLGPGAKHLFDVQLPALAAGIAQFVTENAEPFANHVTKSWVLPFTDWVTRSAIPEVLGRLEQWGEAVVRWASTDGVVAMAKAGLALWQAFRDAPMLLGKEIADDFKKTISDYMSESDEFKRRMNLTPAQRQNENLLRAQNAQDLADQQSMRNQLAPNYQAPEWTPPSITLPELPAFTPTRSAFNWDTFFKPGGAGGSGAEAAPEAERTAREIGQRVAESAIEGFMRAGQSNLSRWEALMGEFGGKGASLFDAAVRENTGQTGEALRGWVDEAAKRMREAGVTDFQEVADQLAGTFHDALVDRGDPAMRAAALEMIRTVTETIKAANALTPESFAHAFDAAELASFMGSQGASIADAFGKGIEEGGAQNIQSLARNLQGMKTALLNNPDFTPDRAHELFMQVFDQVNAAIADGSQEALGKLQQFLRDFDFSNELERIGTNAADRANAAITQAQEQIHEIEAGRDRSIAALTANFNTSRSDREALQGEQDRLQVYVDDAKAYVEGETLKRQAAKETAALQRQELKETADLEQHYQEARDALLKRAAAADTSSTGQFRAAGAQAQAVSPHQAAGDQLAQQLRDLDANHVKEMGQLAETQSARRAERDRVVQEQTEDRAFAKEMQAISSGTAQTQQVALQAFRDQFELNVTIPRQASALWDSAKEQADKISTALNTNLDTWRTETDTAISRWQYLHDSLIPDLTAGYNGMLDGYVDDAQRGHDLIADAARLAGIAASGGTSNPSSLPLPPPPVDLPEQSISTTTASADTSAAPVHVHVEVGGQEVQSYMVNAERQADRRGVVVRR